MKKKIAVLAAAILMACSFSACRAGTVQENAGTQMTEADQVSGTEADQAQENAAAQATDGEQSSGSGAAAPGEKAGAEAAETEAAKAETGTGRLSIVTTIFPEYDWVRNILGDNPAGAEVTMLLDNGVDLHSYQPTAEDMLKIANCDMFLYVGGESDEWVEDALAEGGKESRVVINLLEMLGDRVVEEELVEGMEAEEEGEEEEEEEGPEYDEHVWLSLRNASVLVDGIARGLESLDADNAATYRQQAEAYEEKLDTLDAAYQSAVESAGIKTLLFGDRFPFRYLTEDYGLDYYAAFVGCSAETEASFETVVFLAQKVDELSLKTIMTIEGPDHRIAETIRDNTQAKDQQILTLDSMQATTTKDVEQGTTYLSVMEQNLAVLQEALK